MESLGIRVLHDNALQSVNVEKTLKDKLVLLYFSASWCPPCRAFSPILSDFAAEHSNDVVVIFVSHDHSAQDMAGFIQNKHFFAIPFTDINARQELSSKFSINALPTLCVVHPDGTFVSSWGRSAIMKNPDGCIQEWKNKESGISWLQLFKFW